MERNLAPPLRAAAFLSLETAPSIMSLKERLAGDMKVAMKAREAKRLSALRMLLAAVRQKEIDERTQLDDPQVISIVEKLMKQRRDSIAQFQTAGRQDLVDAESFELEVLEAYLPQQISEAEIASEIGAAIGQTGAASAKDMGKVMGVLKGRLAGRADMARVSALVKVRLAG